MIRSATPDDAKAICAIYNHYVKDTIITFEEKSVSIEDMRKRIGDVTGSFPWLISEQQGKVTGYAYASRLKARRAYRFSVESTGIGEGIEKILA